MTKDEISQYLTELGAVIEDGGRKTEIAIAGGAAMMFLVGNRDATKDIDAYLGSDASAVREAAKTVAARHGLPDDWINDGLKGFFYGTPPQTVALDVPGLTVYSVTPEYLFAMKAMAGRASDVRDLRALIGVLGLKSAAEATTLVERWIPSSQITMKVSLLLGTLFDSA